MPSLSGNALYQLGLPGLAQKLHYPLYHAANAGCIVHDKGAVLPR